MVKIYENVRSLLRRSYALTMLEEKNQSRLEDESERKKIERCTEEQSKALFDTLKQLAQHMPQEDFNQLLKSISNDIYSQTRRRV